MFNRLFACILSLYAVSSFANPGFITHKIINQTNQDFDFILRQSFLPPLFGCAENVPANQQKTCSGEFDNSNGLFVFDFFTNKSIQVDTRITARIRGMSNTQNITLTWTIVNKPNHDFDVNIRIN
jgi:hypothetical protein